MIEFFSSWVKNIIYIIIFIVFLEILLPNNSMRKYVKMVAGLLIILVILTPITGLMNKKLNLQDLVAKNFIDIEQIDMKSKNVILEDKQSDMTMRIYVEKLKNQIKNQLESNFEGIKANVELQIFKESKDENFGSIKNINLILTQNEKTEIKERLNSEEGQIKESQVEEITHIKKIEIGKLNEEQEKEETETLCITQDQEKEIKEFFLDFYNVLPQNISINKQRNNMWEEKQ